MDFTKLTSSELEELVAAAKKEQTERAEKEKQERIKKEEEERRVKAEKIVKARKQILSAFVNYEKILGRKVDDEEYKEMEKLLKLYEMGLFNFKFYI